MVVLEAILPVVPDCGDKLIHPLLRTDVGARIISLAFGIGYFATVATLPAGIVWPVHLWAGVLFMSVAVGGWLGYLAAGCPGVSFMLAILSGGVVAVIAQRIASRDARAVAREAFADARRLQEEERKARERALVVAVVHELAANGTMLKSGSGGTGMAMLHRSAWDAARTLVLPSEVVAALAMAYLHVDSHSRTAASSP